MTTLSVGSFSDTVKHFTKADAQLVDELYSNAKEKNIDNALLTLNQLEESNKILFDAILLHIKNNISNWIREDAQKAGEALAMLALHIDNKKKRYEEIKRALKNTKSTRESQDKILELIRQNNSMKNFIQQAVDIAYVCIDAKTTFMFLATTAKAKQDIVIDDYWINPFENDHETLFLVSTQVARLDIDKIFDIEDNLNTALIWKNSNQPKIKFPETDGYNFGGIGKPHFKNISFI